MKIRTFCTNLIALLALSACGSQNLMEYRGIDLTNLNVGDIFFDLTQKEALLPGPSQTCTLRSDGGIDIGKTWVARDPDLLSTQSETWYPGPHYGRETSEMPNIGYSDPLGEIINGTPNEVQPTVLGCGRFGALQVGWRFSNNAASLTSEVNLGLVKLRPNARGTTLIEVDGFRRERYLDPATVAPYTNEVSQAYYDETSEVGTVTLTKETQIGSARNPNRFRMSKSIHGKTSVDFDAEVYSEAQSPIRERLVRSLINDRLLERHVLEGKYKAVHRSGAVVVTKVRDVLFRRDLYDNPNTPARKVCDPIHGVIEHEFRRVFADKPSLVITIGQRYGRDQQGPTQNGRSVNIRCSGEISARDCIRRGRIALDTYGPPACLY